MKVYVDIISILGIGSQQDFAQAMTALLSWYVQNFVVIVIKLE